MSGRSTKEKKRKWQDAGEVKIRRTRDVTLLKERLVRGENYLLASGFATAINEGMLEILSLPETTRPGAKDFTREIGRAMMQHKGSESDTKKNDVQKSSGDDIEEKLENGRSYLKASGFKKALIGEVFKILSLSETDRPRPEELTETIGRALVRRDSTSNEVIIKRASRMSVGFPVSFPSTLDEDELTPTE